MSDLKPPKEVWVSTRPIDVERGWTNNSTYFDEGIVHAAEGAQYVRYVLASVPTARERRLAEALDSIIRNHWMYAHSETQQAQDDMRAVLSTPEPTDEI